MVFFARPRALCSLRGEEGPRAAPQGRAGSGKRPQRRHVAPRPAPPFCPRNGAGRGGGGRGSPRRLERCPAARRSARRRALIRSSEPTNSGVPRLLGGCSARPARRRPPLPSRPRLPAPLPRQPRSSRRHGGAAGRAGELREGRRVCCVGCAFVLPLFVLFLFALPLCSLYYPLQKKIVFAE